MRGWCRISRRTKSGTSDQDIVDGRCADAEGCILITEDQRIGILARWVIRQRLKVSSFALRADRAAAASRRRHAGPAGFPPDCTLFSPPLFFVVPRAVRYAYAAPPAPYVAQPLIDRRTDRSAVTGLGTATGDRRRGRSPDIVLDASAADRPPRIAFAGIGRVDRSASGRDGVPRHDVAPRCHFSLNYAYLLAHALRQINP